MAARLQRSPQPRRNSATQSTLIARHRYPPTKRATLFHSGRACQDVWSETSHAVVSHCPLSDQAAKRSFRSSACDRTRQGRAAGPCNTVGECGFAASFGAGGAQVSPARPSSQLLAHPESTLAALVIAVILVGQLESARLEQASASRVAVRHVESDFLDRHPLAEG